MRVRRVPLRIELDESVDAAYVYLTERIGAGEAVAQVIVEDDRLAGEVILDLDVDGHVLGIEVLGARDLLPASLPSR
jgi:uncharacterized protein YuzE